MYWIEKHFHFIPFPAVLKTTFLSQVQPQTHQSASPSPPRSHQAVGRGPTSAQSVTRTWWTRSSTPVGTCVCATLAASNSRRCPTPAVPSAEDRSKTLSRRTAARKRAAANGRWPQRNPRVREGKAEVQWIRTLVLWFGIFIRLLLVGFLSWPFPKPVPLLWQGLCHSRCHSLSAEAALEVAAGSTKNFALAGRVCSLLGTWNTLKEKVKKKKKNQICWAMSYELGMNTHLFGAECLENSSY